MAEPVFTTSFSFPNMFDTATGKMILKQNYDSIVNRVGILLKAYKGEEFMFPRFGCTFPDVLLQYRGKERVKQARQAIMEAILEFEPFVNGNQIEVIELPTSNENSLKLAVTLKLDKDYEARAGTIEWSFDEEGIHL